METKPAVKADLTQVAWNLVNLICAVFGLAVCATFFFLGRNDPAGHNQLLTYAWGGGAIWNAMAVVYNYITLRRNLRSRK